MRAYPLRYPSEKSPAPQAMVGQLRSQRLFSGFARGGAPGMVLSTRSRSGLESDDALLPNSPMAAVSLTPKVRSGRDARQRTKQRAHRVRSWCKRGRKEERWEGRSARIAQDMYVGARGRRLTNSTKS